MNKHPPDLPESIQEFIENFKKIEVVYTDYITRIYLIPEEDIWKSKNLEKKVITSQH